MRKQNLDLIVVLVLCMMNVIWAILAYHVPAIGLILAFPLVFLLPGYVLTRVFSYQRSLDISHYLVFSLGLSLSIDVVSGFLLNFLPGGLQATSWAILLAVFTAFFALLTAYLQRKTQVKVGDEPSQRIHFTFSNVAVFLLAIAIAVLSVLYSIQGIIEQPRVLFTQLWVLPANQSQQRCEITVGVQNFEAASTTYTISISINGVQLRNWSGVSLNPQDKWQQDIALSSQVAKPVYVDVQLYRSPNEQVVYRHVNLTMYLVKSQANGNEQHCTDQG